MKTTHSNGFTLVEVLVALAVIAIAMGALIKASGSHTHKTTYLKQKTMAHYVAMNEITRLQVTEQWPDIGSEDKTSEMAEVEWFWQREILKTADENTRQVRITVYEDEAHERNLARLVGYLPRPAAADSPGGQ